MTSPPPLNITINGVRPLVVTPSQASILLNIGITHLYSLMHEGRLETYKDGKNRKITVRSIEAYILTQLKNAPLPNKKNH